MARREGLLRPMEMRSRTAAPGEAGMVTAEIAVALPAVVLERGELTCVHVSRPVPGPLGGLGLTARSTACAYTEPTG